ncbi:YhcH/YjgK/YiaL family protein [Ruficoccus amylovorans]|uniref:YhcH/YjgK/YiaL family protein n=1 Tax=Ruficoccus amylovorans TaxID=1804625 RepID=A0A842HBF4_9BACT|nr:YhcH/YjgK/YiaL family protein [Ruficoccus amylovorans]MBC2592957.1 YhcH/YjgK/YiaL family protein [Ruficoccus amylovorans]
MIYDHLEQQFRYRNCHPGLDLAFDYLAGFDPGTPDGRVDLDGDRVFALVQSYTTSPADGRQFESHYNYVDLQYMVSGEEIIYHSPLDVLSESIPYDAERDVIFYSGAASQALILTPGMFTVLFPQDGHLPCCSHQADVESKKVVIKLRV